MTIIPEILFGAILRWRMPRSLVAQLVGFSSIFVGFSELYPERNRVLS
jgi:hypothetical protein